MKTTIVITTFLHGEKLATKYSTSKPDMILISNFIKSLLERQMEFSISYED